MFAVASIKRQFFDGLKVVLSKSIHVLKWEIAPFCPFLYIDLSNIRWVSEFLLVSPTISTERGSKEQSSFEFCHMNGIRCEVFQVLYKRDCSLQSLSVEMVLRELKSKKKVRKIFVFAVA